MPDPAAEMATADEIPSAIQQWLDRAEEEAERDAEGIVELPLQQAEEVTPADHRSRSRSPGAVGAPLTVRSSGLEAMQVRRAERAHRSASTSRLWELRTGGAVRAWLPLVGQDRRRAFSHMLCPDICGDSEMRILSYNVVFFSFSLFFVIYRVPM